MTEQEFFDLAAAAALGTLDSDDAARFTQALAAHPEWQTLLDQEVATAALLGETVAPEAPRSEVKSALMGELDTLIAAGMPPSSMREELGSAEIGHQGFAPQDLSHHPGTPHPSSSEPLSALEAPQPQEPSAAPELPDEEELVPKRRRGLQLLATLAIVGLFVGGGAGLFGVLSAPQAEEVTALEQVIQAADVQSASTPVEGGGEAGLSWSASEGKAVLVTEGLPSAPSGHTYEMWWVRGDQKIPAGTFDPDQEGGAAVLVEGDMHAGDTVAVTVEVTGGSQDGNPSDMLVFAIPTASGGSA